jgi:hypothetical protein
VTVCRRSAPHPLRRRANARHPRPGHARRARSPARRRHRDDGHPGAARPQGAGAVAGARSCAAGAAARAGVQHPLRVQRGLDAAHQLQRHRRLARCASSSRLSAPMPCSAENEPPKRATASKTMVLTRCSSSARKRCAILARRGLHVVVQVAVAQVAEVDQAHARDRRPAARRRCCATKSGNGRHRHRDVVLDVQAFLGLRQRIDSRTCHSAGDCARLSATTASLTHAALQRAPSTASKRSRAWARLRCRFAPAARSRVRRAAAGQGREVPRHQVQRKAAHHLEAGQARAQPRRARRSSATQSPAWRRRPARWSWPPAAAPASAWPR